VTRTFATGTAGRRQYRLIARFGDAIDALDVIVTLVSA
jgi:hypothetical protein